MKIYNRKISFVTCIFILFIMLLFPSGIFSFETTLTKESVHHKITWLASQESIKKSGLSVNVLSKALEGMQRADIKKEQRVSNTLTIIDFSKSSNVKRLFVIDISKGELLFQSLVAHGKGSGEEFATRFSNVPGSFESSTGFFITGETYQGKHGYSLHLKGMDPGINNAAEDRAIVFHAADYVTTDFIALHGRLGRSQGCFAIPEKYCQAMIDAIKGGSCVYAYARE